MNEMSDASGVELAILKHAAQSNIPVNGSIELLPLCNMNCDMCYVRLDAAQMKKNGRLRTISEWLSLAQEMKEAGTLFLLLTGGEPLLYPEFRTLYTELMSMGMILTVNTNGTLIDEDWADFFAAHKPRRINLTLYGTDNAAYERLCHYKGGYDKASTAIQLLKARCVDVKVGCSAVTSNINDADRIFALADDLGAAVNIDSYMYPTTRERGVAYDTQMRLDPAHAALIWFKSIRHSMSGDQYRSYHNAMLQNVERRKNLADTGSQQISGMQCMAGNCSFTVNWQGMLRPCVMLSSPSVPVFEKGFAQSWKMLCAELKNIRLNPKCSTCHLRPFCRICAASALYESGSYEGIPDYLCALASECYELLKGDTVDDN